MALQTRQYAPQITHASRRVPGLSEVRMSTEYILRTSYLVGMVFSVPAVAGSLVQGPGNRRWCDLDLADPMAPGTNCHRAASAASMDRVVRRAGVRAALGLCPLPYG